MRAALLAAKDADAAGGLADALPVASAAGLDFAGLPAGFAEDRVAARDHGVCHLRYASASERRRLNMQLWRGLLVL